MERVLLTKGRIRVILSENDGYTQFIDRNEGFILKFIKNGRVYIVYPKEDEKADGKMRVESFEIPKDEWDFYSLEEIRQFLIDCYDELTIPVPKSNDTVGFQYDLRGYDNYGHVITVPGGITFEEAFFKRRCLLEDDAWPYDFETGSNGVGERIVSYDIVDRETGEPVKEQYPSIECENRIILEHNNGFTCEGRTFCDGKLVKQHFLVKDGMLLVATGEEGEWSEYRPCDQEETKEFILFHL